jgi:TRAP-type mannitol/chloroaromatic compound transport system substrate-binding protein
MERRRFIAKAGSMLAVVGATAVVDAPNVIAQPKYKWRMPTLWPPALDVLLGSGQRLAKIVEEMTGGRFQIEVFPAGQIMPPLGAFDAASQGTVESFMGSTVSWPTKDPSLVYFCTIPFGMNPEGMLAWFYQGDGLKLWEEMYATYNLVPRPGPAVAPQMAGWFRKKINTIGDFKGLKMRIPGLGGKVVAKAGGSVVFIPGGEIYAALERGVIDASEWIGPYDDMKLNLHNTARYYYYPGWHEPGAMLEFTFNKKAYDSLPVDLQRTLDQAVAAVQVYGLTDFHTKHSIALEKLKTEFKGKVDILQLPTPVLRDLKKLAIEVNREESEKSPMAKRAYASYTKFQSLVGPWDHIAEGAYHQYVAG